MHTIFYPRSIVVVGVSEQPDNLARNILFNLLAFHYQGEIYAVGRQPGQAHGIPIVPSLEKVPDGLDLAVILTPAASVPALVDACGRKGIRRVVVESGGFSEFSPQGSRLEDELDQAADRHGIRFVGPNCISVVNLENGLCLPFTVITPRTVYLGRASVIAQSGGVSITYLDMLCGAGVGVNKAISIGNKRDLDETDYLNYLLQDPGTSIVCMYLESIGDGRRLMDLARSSTKPVIVHKANRGQASQSVAHSHTAALADDDRIVSAALRQAGMLRVEGFADAVAVAKGLSLPPVQGSNLVIISRSGGHAVIAADATEQHGFQLAPLPEDFAGLVRALFRADVIALNNPIDLGVIFDFDLYAQVVEECLRTLSPDALMLINTYGVHEVEGARRLAHRVEEIVHETNKPVALCIYAQGDEFVQLQREMHMPIFSSIEEALRGLAASREWTRIRTARAAATAMPVSAPSVPAAQHLPDGMLTADLAQELCRSYGIPVADWQVVDDSAGAVEAAGRLGYPVAVKLLSPDVIHKSDAGGVVLGLSGRDAVQSVAREMLTRQPGARLMVQCMAGEGVEVFMGGKRDHAFGPVVMFGLGGVAVEVMQDVTFRVAPLTERDAEEMIDEVRGHRLLEGVRGRPPVDRRALVEALLALSRLLVENPRVAELDVNPVIASSTGALAVDARAVVG